MGHERKDGHGRIRRARRLRFPRPRHFPGARLQRSDRGGNRSRSAPAARRRLSSGQGHACWRIATLSRSSPKRCSSTRLWMENRSAKSWITAGCSIRLPVSPPSHWPSMPPEKPPKQVIAPDVGPPLPGALGGAPALGAPFVAHLSAVCGVRHLDERVLASVRRRSRRSAFMQAQVGVAPFELQPSLRSPDRALEQSRRRVQSLPFTFRLFPPLSFHEMTQLPLHRLEGVVNHLGQRLVRATVHLLLLPPLIRGPWPPSHQSAPGRDFLFDARDWAVQWRRRSG